MIAQLIKPHNMEACDVFKTQRTARLSCSVLVARVTSAYHGRTVGNTTFFLKVRDFTCTSFKKKDLKYYWCFSEGSESVCSLNSFSLKIIKSFVDQTQQMYDLWQSFWFGQWCNATKKSNLDLITDILLLICLCGSGVIWCKPVAVGRTASHSTPECFCIERGLCSILTMLLRENRQSPESTNNTNLFSFAESTSNIW